MQGLLQYSKLAYTHNHDAKYGWTKTPEKSLKRGIELAKKALSINESDAVAYGCLGEIYSMIGDHEKAMAEGEKAIEIEPNGADVNAMFAITLLFAGRFSHVIERIEKAERLNPISPGWYFLVKAAACHFSGKYEKAIESSKEGLKKMPNNLDTLGLLAASYILLGRLEEASAITEKILKLHPKFSLDEYAKNTERPYKSKGHIERYIDALRKAGLPDKPPLPLPDKPSIAVLPFTNMSGDPKQDFIGEGISEGIITALSKTPKLFVIARNSSFTYKGKSVKVQQIGRDLGVRYVLEGSVQKSENRLRITAQLVDAKTGNHLWADKYYRDLKNIFAIQDEITMKIITELQVEITEGEQSRVYGRSTNNLEAYVKVLKGRERLYSHTQKDNHLAMRLLEEAIALDPNYTTAYEFLAHCHWMDAVYGWSKSRAASIKRGFELAEKILSLDKSSAGAHRVLSTFYYLKRRYDMAIEEGKQAISLDPNDADGYAYLGMNFTNMGRAEEANIWLKKAIRLNPHPPHWYLLNLGASYRMMGQYEEAIANYKKVLERDPNHPTANAFCSVALSWKGRHEEAIASIKKAIDVGPAVWHFTCLAEYYRRLGRYEEAIAACKRVFDHNPIDRHVLRAYVTLTAAYSALGREDDARGAATEILRINPNFSLEREKDVAYGWFIQHKADKELVDIALNKARLK